MRGVCAWERGCEGEGGERVCVFDMRWQLVSPPLVSLFLLFPASLSPPAHAAPALAAHVPPLWKHVRVLLSTCVYYVHMRLHYNLDSRVVPFMVIEVVQGA